MRRWTCTELLVVVLLVFFQAASASAVSPDPRLLSLVPPSARVIAGMKAPSSDGQPKSFILVTPNNSIDLVDFIALTGGDPTRAIEQLMMVAAEDGRGDLTEHSLLVSGRFDQALLRRSTGASATLYRDIPVLVVQPFARERANFNDVRWLAMINSNVLIFGTISMVKQELDRYLSRSVADPFLVEKLARLRRDTDTWCVLPRAVYSDEIRSSLRALDAKLADSLQDGDNTFEFGIHYGRRVEFEYEIDMATSVGNGAVSRSLVQSLAGRDLEEPSVLPTSGSNPANGVVRGVVKVSKGRYDAWVAEVRGGFNLRIAAARRDPTTH